MGTKKLDGGAGPLEKTRQRFERWRRTRSLGTRIPQSLWDAAAKMARIYGIYQTASTLRVDYYSLKRRVEEKEAASAPAAQDQTMEQAATFIELPAVSNGTAECVLELEDAGGAKMRVHLKGVAAPDLAALSRSFWGGQP